MKVKLTFQLQCCSVQPKYTYFTSVFETTGYQKNVETNYIIVSITDSDTKEKLPILIPSPSETSSLARSTKFPGVHNSRKLEPYKALLYSLCNEGRGREHTPRIYHRFGSCFYRE